jgi:peptidyl-prolyl cis-trans isomerase D
MARADLLDQMTTEALTKATDELKVKLDKDTDALSNFATQANQAGAKVATYGPFVNPDTLLSNINLSAANSQAELQAVLEKALSSPLAPSQELPEPGKVFQECTTINPGKTTNPINTGNGLMIVQLVKRELQDSPEFRVKMTQRVIPALTNQTQSLILSDWLRSCIDQYKVEVDPMVNRQN